MNYPSALKSFQDVFPEVLKLGMNDAQYLEYFYQKIDIENSSHVSSWYQPLHFLLDSQVDDLLASSEEKGLEFPGNYDLLKEVVESYYDLSGEKPIRALQYLYLMAINGDKWSMNTLANNLHEESCDLEAYHWVLEASDGLSVPSRAPHAIKINAFNHHDAWRLERQNSDVIELDCGINVGKVSFTQKPAIN